MVQPLLLSVGVGIMLVVCVDVVATTVSSGSPMGGFAAAVTRLVHGTAIYRTSSPRDLRLRIAGPMVTVAVLATWIGALWLAWALVFSADPEAVVVATSGQPVGGLERVYFAGMNLSTLGTGDLRADGPLWRLATTLAAFTGLTVVTLSVTFLVPVVSAVTHRNQVAARIAMLGTTPDEIVRELWDGAEWRGLKTLDAISAEILMIAERHRTYPILHYFHSADPVTAFPRNIAVLDEALSLMTFGVDARGEEGAVRRARRAVARLLELLAEGFVPVGSWEPPPPPLDALSEAGLPTIEQSTFDDRLRDQAARRRHVAAFVQHDRWSWPDASVRPERAGSRAIGF